MSSAAQLQRLADALAAFDVACGIGPTPDSVATAFATHLATLDAAKLPLPAQPGWMHVRRLLKAPNGALPIPARVIAGIASWPSSRVAELVEGVRTVAAVLERAANDRLADETNERVSRAYL